MSSVKTTLRTEKNSNKSGWRLPRFPCSIDLEKIAKMDDVKKNVGRVVSIIFEAGSNHMTRIVGWIVAQIHRATAAVYDDDNYDGDGGGGE